MKATGGARTEAEKRWPTRDDVEAAAVAMYFEDCGNTPSPHERRTDEFDAQFRAMARVTLESVRQVTP